jgi:S-methylmethionine-dependent homocysteine/selenocysteine methylase
VANASGCEQDDPHDLGASVKKLAYYTYKLMVQKLEGSDWSSTETLPKSGELHAYRFTSKATGKPVWVAWNDSAASQPLTVAVGDATSVRVTGAVPQQETGQAVTEFATAFSWHDQQAEDGKVTLVLDDIPVFVEPL